MSDILVKALGYNSHARIYAVTTTDALNIIGDRLSYFPSALDALGRVMSMGAIMGGTLKGEETATLRIDGDGQIGRIVVDANAHGAIRGYAENPHCHFEYVDDNKLNVKATVGDTGFINVIKDLKLKEPFVGSIPIINGELGEDFAYYFSVSEQVPSAVALGVLVDENNNAISAGGFIVQLLPNTPDLVIDLLEERIKELSPYRVTKELMDNAGESCKFMHCLPAFHDLNTTIGKEVFDKYGLYFANQSGYLRDFAIRVPYSNYQGDDREAWNHTVSHRPFP